MSQSKLASFVEAIVNGVSGLLFSFAIQKVLIWAYDVEMSDVTALSFVFWFTIASILRSYIIRRIGNSSFWNKYGN